MKCQLLHYLWAAGPLLKIEWSRKKRKLQKRGLVITAQFFHASVSITLLFESCCPWKFQWLLRTLELQKGINRATLFTEAGSFNMLNESIAADSGDDRSMQVERLLGCRSRTIPWGVTRIVASVYVFFTYLSLFALVSYRYPSVLVIYLLFLCLLPQQKKPKNNHTQS